MSFLATQIKPDAIKAFCSRNGGTTVSNNALECLAGFYAEDGATGTRLPELEATWLSGKGAIGNRLEDLWGNYLKALGYTGNLRDMMSVFVTSGNPVGSPANNLLTESDAFLIQEDGSDILLEQ